MPTRGRNRALNACVRPSDPSRPPLRLGRGSRMRRLRRGLYCAPRAGPPPRAAPTQSTPDASAAALEGLSARADRPLPTPGFHPAWAARRPLICAHGSGPPLAPGVRCEPSLPRAVAIPARVLVLLLSRHLPRGPTGRVPFSLPRCGYQRVSTEVAQASVNRGDSRPGLVSRWARPQVRAFLPDLGQRLGSRRSLPSGPPSGPQDADTRGPGAREALPGSRPPGFRPARGEEDCLGG